MNKKEEKILHNQVINYLESNSKGAIASKIILSTLALGGVVCMGAIAPNIFRAVHGCSRYNDAAKSFKKRSCFSTISKFKKDGLIQLQKQKNGAVKVMLTEKGYRHVRDFTYRPVIKKPKIWDKKWRVVIFDIPIEKRRQHDMFRRSLKEMGFKQIQKSVWVYPYKCEDEVLFLARQLSIVNSIEILTVQKMLHIKKLKKKFSL